MSHAMVHMYHNGILSVWIIVLSLDLSLALWLNGPAINQISGCSLLSPLGQTAYAAAILKPEYCGEVSPATTRLHNPAFSALYVAQKVFQADASGSHYGDRITRKQK